ncbi:hypothetical protein Tco_1160333 [Tanacetum coccineum]
MRRQEISGFQSTGGFTTQKVLIGILLLQWAEVGSCSRWDQECSYPRDHFPLLGLEERDHDMVHKLEVIGQGVWLFGLDILKKPSEKHGIGKSHFATLSKVFESESDFDIVDDESNGESFIEVSIKANTFVKL